MGQSPSLPVEHARLLFSSNSLRNTAIQCDALGIHYQLSTLTDGVKNKRLTTVTKWDAYQEKDVLIAELERKLVGKDRIRIPSAPQLVYDRAESEDGFMLVKDFFPRAAGLPGCVHFNRMFTASTEKRYVWKSRQFSLKLYEEGSDVPIAEYGGRHCLTRKYKQHVKLASGCEEILDYIIVTFVIAERKRRDGNRRQRWNNGGGA